MSVILGFDTAGGYVSAALLSDGEVIALGHEEMAKGQAERLFPMLEELLARASLAWADLNAIGVGVGPGNFTGIRLSVSAARGLALSLDVPAIGVSALEAVCYGANGPRLACQTARRGQVFVQGFDTTQEIPAQIIGLDDMPRHWGGANVQVMGSASEEVAARLGAVEVPQVHSPGVAIAQIAAGRLDDETLPPKPLYLRPADAAPARDRGPVILDDA